MKKFKALLIAMVCGVISVSAQSIYLDPNQPIDIRVSDLVSKLTLEEKIHQMMDVSPSIPHLNLPQYN